MVRKTAMQFHVIEAISDKSEQEIPVIFISVDRLEQFLNWIWAQGAVVLTNLNRLVGCLNQTPIYV